MLELSQHLVAVRELLLKYIGHNNTAMLSSFIYYILKIVYDISHVGLLNAAVVIYVCEYAY